MTSAAEKDIRGRLATGLERALRLLPRARRRLDRGELDSRTVQRLARRASGRLRVVLAKVDQDPLFEPARLAGEDDVAAVSRTLKVIADRRREFGCRHVLILADAVEALIDGIREHAAQVDGRKWS